MIRTAVIGYGLGGMAFHAPLIEAVEALELAAIVTSRRDQVQAAYPHAQVVADLATVLADPGIELVAISTPNDTHFDFARDALLAGKHVVIDKPFASSVAQGQELDALARERGLVLAGFHNRRWDADFLTVCKLIDEGRLGDIMLFEGRWDRFRPALREGNWHEDATPGGGNLMDLGPHLIDQALVLFGMPEALSADIVAQRPGSLVDDYFEIVLQYGAMRAVVSSASIVPAPRPRFSVHGARASYIKHGIDPQEPHLRAGKPAGGADYGVEPAAAYGRLVDGEGGEEIVPSERGDYRRFYQGVADAIATGRAAPVTAAQAIDSLRIIELARQSAAEGRVLRP